MRFQPDSVFKFHKLYYTIKTPWHNTHWVRF
jgi:hypothetical protein